MNDIEWFEDDSVVWWAEHGACVVAEVRYAREGESEGGIGALARFMAAAAGVAAETPLSPSGWYWVGTVAARGVWCRPVGPFGSAADAKIDATNALAECAR
jgi:hypothetical protein